MRILASRYLVLPLFAFTALLPAQDASKAWQTRRMEWQTEQDKGKALVIVNHFGDVRVRTSPFANLSVIGIIQEREGQIQTLDLEKELGADQDRLIVTYDGKLKDHKQITSETRFDLTVLVPETAKLHIETKATLIEAKGLKNDLYIRNETGPVRFSTSGHVDIESRQGDITGTLKEITSSQPYKIVSLHGTIQLKIPHNASLKATLRTEQLLATDFSVDIKFLDHAQKEGLVTLGAGKHELLLDSRRGDVQLLRLPEMYNQ